jgi:putative membrane protein
VVEFAIVMGIIAAFVLVLVAGLEGIDRGKHRRELEIDPEDVLAARFAKGEIDETEYSRRLSVLRHGPPLELSD